MNEMRKHNNKCKLLDSDLAALDKLSFAMDIVIKGQGELGVDYIDVVDYMQYRGFSDDVINSCFSVWAGRKIIVTGN